MELSLEKIINPKLMVSEDLERLPTCKVTLTYRTKNRVDSFLATMHLPADLLILIEISRDDFLIIRRVYSWEKLPRHTQVDMHYLATKRIRQSGRGKGEMSYLIRLFVNESFSHLRWLDEKKVAVVEGIKELNDMFIDLSDTQPGGSNNA